jgi:hypothetical protein
MTSFPSTRMLGEPYPRAYAGALSDETSTSVHAGAAPTASNARRSCSRAAGTFGQSGKKSSSTVGTGTSLGIGDGEELYLGRCRAVREK